MPDPVHPLSALPLLEKQQLFTRLVADLIAEAYTRGYRLTFGEAMRSDQEAERLAALGRGIRNSVHRLRLAVDLNLFMRGADGRFVYQTTSEAYRPLGEYWKQLHPLCRWGGDFARADGNHFSLEHDGRA